MTKLFDKPANVIVRSHAEAPHLKKAALAIEHAAWTESGYLNYTKAHYEYYSELVNRFPEYQLCLVDEDSALPDCGSKLCTVCLQRPGPSATRGLGLGSRDCSHKRCSS
jgi:hypothetical protein